jgi:hypothetical protein
MQARYRSDYAGEFVILETQWLNGKRTEKREWISNPIDNQHISGRAACIGSNTDKTKFDYTILQRHRGGLLSSKKLQTYGVGSLAHDMPMDFAVETNATLLPLLIENKYSENHVIYTTGRNCINYPGQFYLIPNNPKLLDISTIAYLAAFDGHQEIFLLGYNRDTPAGNPNWHTQLCSLIESYAGVKFYFVGEKTNMFPEWMELPNTTFLTYRDFIGYCDV